MSKASTKDEIFRRLYKIDIALRLLQALDDGTIKDPAKDELYSFHSIAIGYASQAMSGVFDLAEDNFQELSK
ncbi:MAG: hypothetical protein LC541_18260 [Candidatus Thiodiazotropha sp.]|nr:hypothetical protein [Candidatus Thiodiazotropha sp.]MCM8885214.1 hypothetical protein [Candidatus Thiodiazotropha sp.]MCM8921002.1 hypothetical protein [Candidatus Thiodiazotropha sp.]